ncbi:MAG: putative glycoside hydrolase [Gemmatimonadaceae bacterium]
MPTRISTRSLISILTIALTAACGDERGGGAGAQTAAKPAGATADSAGGAIVGPGGVATVAEPGDITKLRNPNETPIIRALYVNRFAAQSPAKMRKLMAFVDTTELNALVIDMKDEFGLNYRSADSAIRRNQGSGKGIVPNVKALIDTLHAHNIFTIARIVTFKDPVAAQVNPDWQIRRTDGSTWRDEKGHAWVNAYNRQVWEYNLGIAEELAKLGFDEIQWDYIRFPEPYRRLPLQVFPGASGVSKPDALAAFLKVAKERLNKVGVRSTADVFGFVTTVRAPLEIGQHWERLAPVTDVLLPMCYPSHYPPGTWGIPRPNAEPYKILKIAIDSARVRNEKLGIKKPEHVRPWIQAFTLGKPPYDATHIREQKRAIYDAGYDGWVLWHPGSNYDIFMPAIEKTLEPRKKSAAEVKG